MYVYYCLCDMHFVTWLSNNCLWTHISSHATDQTLQLYASVHSCIFNCKFFFRFFLIIGMCFSNVHSIKIYRVRLSCFFIYVYICLCMFKVLMNCLVSSLKCKKYVCPIYGAYEVFVHQIGYRLNILLIRTFILIYVRIL